MSLDVSLISEEHHRQVGTGIFIRINGRVVEIDDEEIWKTLNPDRDPYRVIPEDNFTNVVFRANITHNLGRMASEAGIYDVLWKPSENNITFAEELIIPLTTGLSLLKGNRARFELFNPTNGWGDYDGLVNFVAEYLEACQKYPTARVETSR